ncbi:MAG: hypothetical protein JNL21_18140 [Myxococcales bacterium]|nr:hypothetical protein [Myxococcales bacterium]
MIDTSTLRASSLLGFFLLVGCAAREEALVRLVPEELALAKETGAKLCAEDGTSFPAAAVSPVSRQRLTGDGTELYTVGPVAEPPPSPFLISGLVLGGTGLLGIVVSGVAATPCLGPAGCDLPGWVEPLAWTSLGVALTGGVLLIVYAADPDLGRFKGTDVRDLGEAGICK